MKKILLPLLTIGLLLMSCSETRNLAEDETLYVGIRDIAYDRPPKEEKVEQPEEGVITAVANAYNTVSGLLMGEKSAAELLQTAQQDGLDKQQIDSLRQISKKDAEAYRIAQEEVEGVLAYSPNNSLMGSSRIRHPFAFGLWIYNRYVNSTSRWGKWMLNNMAATPVYISTVNPRLRTQVARNTLRNHGYFRGTADYSLIPQKNARKEKVSYTVTPGPLFHLDTIAYQRFPHVADSIIRQSMSQTLLHQGDPFSTARLDAERKRLSTLFRDNGYYYFRPEYIAYRADTLMRPQYVQLQVRPSADMPVEASHPYHMGRTRINLYSYGEHQLVDTIGRRHLTMAHSGRVGHPPLKMRAMARYLRYRRGELYSQTLHDKMLDNLHSMGVFSQLTTHYIPRDTTALCDTLDMELTAILDKPYDAEFQGNLATKSNGQVGPGVSFSMSKMNAFRAAETVSLEAHASYEFQTGAQMKERSNIMNSFEYGASLNLTFPRLTMLGMGQRWGRRATTSTTYKLTADWLNRAGFFGRVSFGARMAYSYQRRPTIKHELVPFRLDYDMQLHSTARFDSIISANEALYVSMRDQFVPSAQYTLAMTSRQQARNPRAFTLVAKEAGNLTSGLYRACGQSWTRTNKHLFGVPFAQYFKLTAEYTERFRLGSTKTYLATRLFAGTVVSYGNSTIAPYSDLFTVGGANSIRAFGVRSIGPGSYNPRHSGYSYIDEMGDLKLEANVEYRFPLVASLYGAMFVDAGNVWLMKPDEGRPGGSIRAKTFGREIALGSGFGFRYDMDFIVIRFDVGVGLHAPYDTGKSGYYNMTKFWDSLGFHLAIGYPF